MSQPNPSCRNCKKLDNKRRIAWKSYYEAQRVLFETLVENRRMSQEMQRIADEQKLELPPHFKEELVKNLKELDCPVCFDTMTIETFTLTKCFHKICKQCLDKLRMSGRCPICRANL